MGHVFESKDYHSKELSLFKIYKDKSKEGFVERANNAYEVICRGMFKKETNLELFKGLRVSLSSGETGKIEGSFGQSGKFKVSIEGGGLKEETKAALEGASKKGKKGSGGVNTKPNSDPIRLRLDFKRYIFSKKMLQ